MQWIAFLSDKQPLLMTKELLKAHTTYLTKIAQAGELIFCGPVMNGTALMVFNTQSKVQAKSLVEADPFSKVSYYQTIRFEQFMEANLENGFLLESSLDYMDSSEYKPCSNN